MMSQSALRLVAASCLFLIHTAAQAADVKISGEQPREQITVSVENAKTDRVLDALQKRYGFELVGLANAAEGDALTVTLSGSLRTVLERLLRNRNHMIVQSTEKASGIEKVMILNSAYGALSNRPAQKLAKGNENAAFLNALTGGGDIP